MLNLSIISPVKKILQTECVEIAIPTTSGPIVILPKHISLFSVISSGKVNVKKKDGSSQSVVVSGGVVSVSGGTVTMLVNFGIHSDEIDEKIVLEAKARVQKILQESDSENIIKVAKANLLHLDLQLEHLPKPSGRHV